MTLISEWLVKGFDTTYSVDCKSANGESLDSNQPLDNKGDVTFIARQKTKAGGDIVVAGGVFLSDFEVKAEIDNNDSLPFANAVIVNNILDGVTVELPTSTIAEARAGEMNEVFAVEGYVTSGTSLTLSTFRTRQQVLISSRMQKQALRSVLRSASQALLLSTREIWNLR